MESIVLQHCQPTDAKVRKPSLDALTQGHPSREMDIGLIESV
jgi:hypothetical protein